MPYSFRNPLQRFALTAPLLLATGVAAQEPNVLPLSKTYHVGLYDTDIENPSGALSLRGVVGRMDMTPAGVFSGSLDGYETDPVAGTVAVVNDPFDGLYSVRGDGICLLDLEPLAPGTDVAPAWIAPDGSMLHAVSSRVGDDAASLIAIEVSTGLSNATLTGTYQVVAQSIEFDPSSSSAWRIDHEFGTAQFDGAGNGVINGTKIESTNAGSSTSALSSSFLYSVASDGAVTIGGATGACTANGELLYLLTAQPTGEVGLVVGVRVGSSYDLQSLAGRYSFAGHRYQLGPQPTTFPNSQTRLGELSLAAASSASGSWFVGGSVLETNPSSQTATIFGSGGAATLGGAGLAASELQLSEPVSTWTLWASETGRYLVGREAGPHSHQLFGSRQCTASGPVGSGTQGTGAEVPRLGMRTYPQLQSASFAFAVEGGVGGAICAIPIATASGPGLPAFGGTIEIDVAAIGTTAVVVLDGASGAAGEGSGLAALPIPNNLSLIGFELWAQALVFDAAAVGGVALSNAYRAIICR